MTSKAQRRRRKITLPGGVQLDQRHMGRDRTGTNRKEDASGTTETALRARLSLCGMADTPDNRKAVSAPAYGCAVGRAIIASTSDKNERADLWGAVCHVRRVWVAYDRACGAPNRHAQCLRILSPADAMTTESAPVDDRPQADRDRAAVSAWMRLQGILARSDGAAIRAMSAAVVDEPDRQTVREVDAVLRALRVVVDGIRGA